MPDSLYLATNENATGKRMIALGMMETITRCFARVAFFRPIVRTSAAEDASIALMRSRYELVDRDDAMVGINRVEARELLAADRYDELLQRIQQRFKLLQENADFTVVEGTSFQGLASEIEFELNADLAMNLGCPILAVYSAAEKTLNECLQSIRIGNDGLRDHGGEIFATIVNQVAPSSRDELLQAQAEGRIDPQAPVYFIPEQPLLRQPTLREIQVGADAQMWAGDEAALDRETTVLKVAAMQLPDFLERLVDGSLVITPGDRGDILVGCVLASLNAGAKSPAGVLLTGGMVPPPSIQKLVRDHAGLPILTTNDDTFTAAKRASKVRAEISGRSPKKIESALGLFEQHVQLDVLTERLRAPASKRITPLLFEYSLIRRARQHRAKIVLPEGSEPRILQAVDVIRRRGIADVILLGNHDAIAAAANQVGVRLQNEETESDLQIIDPADSPLRESFAEIYEDLRKHKGMTRDAARDRMNDVSYFGTMMVHQGLAGGMVSGAVHTTAETVRPAFEFIKTPPGVSTVSSVFLMCLKSSVLVYGDCAVIPNPTAEQLAEIACGSAETARQFGIEPRVAMLSYSTGGSGRGEDVDRVREATSLVRKRCPDLMVEGPMQYDAAVDPRVAATKLPDSEVAGRATVLVFPDLNTGNNTYKAVQRSAGALAIGPILQGLQKPVNDLSRGCTVPDIINTVAITAIQANAHSESSNEDEHSMIDRQT
ncbi:MAG: phosphate acetyltransferase, partial [Planctomycetota bacterium]